MSVYTSAGAIISACGQYRYRLWREWRGTGLNENWDWWKEDDGSPAVDGAGQPIGEPLACLFVMLNPSTADGEQDDATIRRCVRFAKAWGYDRLEVVNLFAFRATSPTTLFRAADPVGFDNQRHVQGALGRAGMVVCAWGNHGEYLGQDQTMLGWMEGYIQFIEDREIEITALRLSKRGQPGHPLYLPGDLRPFPFTGRPA